MASSNDTALETFGFFACVAIVVVVFLFSVYGMVSCGEAVGRGGKLDACHSNLTCDKDMTCLGDDIANVCVLDEWLEKEKD